MYGWTTTHSTKSHDDWNANKSSFVLHNKHLLTIAKQGAGKKGAQMKSKSKKLENDSSTSGGLSLIALAEHFAQMEFSVLDPTQAKMAQLLKTLFQGKVQGVNKFLVYLMPFLFEGDDQQWTIARPSQGDLMQQPHQLYL